MIDPAASSEFPSYLEECDKMNFWQLHRYIERALKRLSKSQESGDEDLPRYKEEVIFLCEMLGEKADSMKEDVPESLPEPPVYEGPAAPGSFFTPSEKLDGLYTKRDRYDRRVDEAVERGDSDIYIEYVEDELKKFEREELFPVERAEERRYEERRAEFWAARGPYQERVKAWEYERDERKRKQELQASRDRGVQKMYRETERAFEPKPTGTFQWEFLPPGEATPDRIRRYYEEVMSRGTLDGFLPERLEKVLALPYESWFQGKAGFYGYSIFTFAHTEKVLFECPVYGNAIYVLTSSEERLLRMTKQELRESGEARKILHTGEWYQRLKRELEITADGG